MNSWEIRQGDAVERLAEMADESVHCVVTSPPYWGLRDYGIPGQMGLERTPEEYVEKMVAVFRQVRRVLRKDGTLWLNVGDSYANDGKWGGATGGKHVAALHGNTGVGRTKQQTNLKPKDLVGMPWRLAFALQADGWWLRSDIIWSKPNPMPESVRDRPTKAHEYLFLLTKSARYYYDADAVREEHAKLWSAETNGPVGRNNSPVAQGGMPDPHPLGRNRRTVWAIPTQAFPEAHFATFPEKLVEPCVLAGCPKDGVVLDPFAGSGTVGVVALRQGRNFVGIELNPEYCEMARKRIAASAPMWAEEIGGRDEGTRYKGTEGEGVRSGEGEV